jgi:hypothetical protein
MSKLLATAAALLIGCSTPVKKPTEVAKPTDPCSEGMVYLEPMAISDELYFQAMSPCAAEALGLDFDVPADLNLMNRLLEDSAAPTYNPRAQSWGELPPAAITRSSDHCVGYCFDAIIESVSKKDRRVARVVVIEEGHGPTRAIVHRTRIHSSSAAYEGKPVRFTCFDASYAGTVPRFEDCAAR